MLARAVEAAGYRLVVKEGAILGLEPLGEPYTCGNCGGIFTKTWSDEEAMAEARSLFPAEDLEDGIGIVCDGCFRVIMAWASGDVPELLPRAGSCYRMANGSTVHVKPECRCPR